MFKISEVKNYINAFTIMFSNSFMNFKTEIINYLLNFITIMFYIGIFATILNKEVNNYTQFLLPGLVIFNVLSAVSYQALKLWSLGSTSKLMGYWLSLPYSIDFLLLSFTFMVVFNGIIYSIPLIAVSYILHTSINVIQWLVIIVLSSIFLFFINFFMVIFLFKTNSFVIIFNVSQPLLLRVSPVFYPLIYLPLFALPFSFINPITWFTLALRNEVNFVVFLILMIIFDMVFFIILLNYWKRKIKLGELI